MKSLIKNNVQFVKREEKKRGSKISDFKEVNFSFEFRFELDLELSEWDFMHLDGWRCEEYLTETEEGRFEKTITTVVPFMSDWLSDILDTYKQSIDYDKLRPADKRTYREGIDLLRIMVEAGELFILITEVFKQ